MSERRYTVAEIDALRRCHETYYSFRCYSQENVSNDFVTYRETDRAIVVEQQVRTSMLAGITAEDLIASDSARFATPRTVPSGETTDDGR